MMFLLLLLPFPVMLSQSSCPKYIPSPSAHGRVSISPVGFSDDDSLHADGTGSSSQGLSLAEFVEAVRSKGRSGLCLEYTEIKTKPPDGTFEVAK